MEIFFFFFKKKLEHSFIYNRRESWYNTFKASGGESSIQNISSGIFLACCARAWATRLPPLLIQLKFTQCICCGKIIQFSGTIAMFLPLVYTMVPIMNLIGGNHYYYMRGMNINPKILNNNSHIVSPKKKKKSPILFIYWAWLFGGTYIGIHVDHSKITCFHWWDP